jgi:hypothetical protein
MILVIASFIRTSFGAEGSARSFVYIKRIAVMTQKPSVILLLLMTVSFSLLLGDMFIHSQRIVKENTAVGHS